jgi:beta-glucosidase
VYPVLPQDFVLGASTSAYQIEGAAAEDGRGPSVWDAYSAERGRILDASTGAQACDHYHRYAEDIALMKQLGIGGYRFSIAWPRIQPTGTGSVNEPGLDFYDRLVDGLLAAGIAPMATLYHWDLPQALQDEGGWASRTTVDRFEDYTRLVADRLADRVDYWCPVNEPSVVTNLGHGLGNHAPGKTGLRDSMSVAHHLLLAHGRAVRVLRDEGAAAVGVANNHSPVWVAGDSEQDCAGAEFYDVVWNRLFADPILLGSYPEAVVEMLPIMDGDLELISSPIDFYGLNYYAPALVGGPGRQDGSASVGADQDVLAGLPYTQLDVQGYPLTDFGWPVVPDGLREQLVILKQRYPELPPVHITENGCAFSVGPDVHGVVDDQPRIDYLDSHLRAVTQAVDDGVDVRGYWTWSLLDNWEWSVGFTQRFGLVHIDYETQVRTPKRSFQWYAGLVEANL